MGTSRPYSEIDDGALIHACRRGEAPAWEALVHRYQRLVYTVPRRAGLDDDQCADVFQRVFTLLVEHLDRLTQPERVRAWLVTTARREALRTAQKAGRTQPLAGDADDGDGDEADATDALQDPSPLPGEALLQLEEQHLVRTALARLDERCRQLLSLLFYAHDPLPYEQVAAQVGVPVGSVGPTRARCLQKLGRLLTDAGFLLYFVGLLTLCWGRQLA